MDHLPEFGVQWSRDKSGTASLLFLLANLVFIGAYDKPSFHLDPKQIAVPFNSSVDLKCSLNNEASIDPGLDKTILWCKKGINVLSGIIPGTPSGLHIDSVNPHDVYGCGIKGFACQEKASVRFATTISSSSTTTTTTPAVTVPSTTTVLVKFSKSIIYHQDHSVSVTCTFTNTGPTTLTISWYREGYKLDHVTSRVKISSEKVNETVNVGKIVFETIYHRDDGDYSCVASEPGHSDVEKRFNLYVYYHPTVQISPITSSVKLGSSITLTCYLSNIDKIENNVNKDLHWCKNGTRIPSGSKDVTTIKAGYTVLLITNVTEDVTYSCGSDTCNMKADIFVLKPDTPTCSQSEDRKSNSWNISRAGETVYRVCPVAYTGNISRQCKYDSTWEDVNDYQCVNQTMLDLYARVRNIDERLEPIDVIVSTLRELYELIGDKLHPVTSGDINLAVDLLGEIARVINKTGYTVQQPSKLNFLQTINEILSKDKEPDWIRVHHETETAKALDLMQILQLFGLSLGRHLNKPAVIYETENIDFQIHKTKPVDMVFPSKNATNGTMTVSKKTLENINGSDALLLVVSSTSKTLPVFLNAATMGTPERIKDENGNSLTARPPFFSLNISLYVDYRWIQVTHLNPAVQIYMNPIRRIKEKCYQHSQNSSFKFVDEPEDGTCSFSSPGLLIRTQEMVENIILVAAKAFTGFLMAAFLVLTIIKIVSLKQNSPISSGNDNVENSNDNVENREAEILGLAKNVATVCAYGLFTFGSTSAENLRHCQLIGIFITLFFLLSGFFSFFETCVFFKCPKNTDRNTTTEEHNQCIKDKCCIISYSLMLCFPLVFSAILVGGYIGANGMDGFVTDTKCLPSAKNNAVLLLLVPLIIISGVQIVMAVVHGICCEKQETKKEKTNNKNSSENNESSDTEKAEVVMAVVHGICCEKQETEKEKTNNKNSSENNEPSCTEKAQVVMAEENGTCCEKQETNKEKTNKKNSSENNEPSCTDKFGLKFRKIPAAVEQIIGTIGILYSCYKDDSINVVMSIIPVIVVICNGLNDIRLIKKLKDHLCSFCCAVENNRVQPAKIPFSNIEEAVTAKLEGNNAPASTKINPANMKSRAVSATSPSNVNLVV